MSYSIENSTDAATVQAALGVVPQLLTAQSADPALAAAGKMNVFAKSVANRPVPFIRGSAGIATPLQTALWGARAGIALPQLGQVNLVTLGMTATSIGTATLATFAATNMFTRMNRNLNVSSASAGSTCGYRGEYFTSTGDGAGLGGFFFNTRFAIADAAAVAGALMFVGIYNTTSAIGATVEPSTLVNCIGVGHGSADTNLKIFYGGSSAQTPIDLGATFPTNTLSTDIYELSLYSPSNATGTVYYQVDRINTGHTASGTLTGGSTVLPASTTQLTYKLHRSNNATALAVSLATMHIYKVSDY